MKKCISMVLCLVVLLLPLSAYAASDTLVIAITSESAALNIPAEEAFFQQWPNVTIQYRLYNSEQLSSMMMTGQVDYDLVILDYPTVLNLASKGYICMLDEALGLEEYPDQLLDVSSLVELDGHLFALPVSIQQRCWFWDSGLAEKYEIPYPVQEGAWTWDDFLTLSRQFPQDTNGDGMPDLYLMEGSALFRVPYFQNVNLTMIENFLYQYPEDFEMFCTQHLDTFREVLTSDSLLSMAQVDMGKHPYQVLITQGSGNPLERMSSLLPIPVFDRTKNPQVGSMRVCAMMRNAPHEELAIAYMQAMVSDEALSMAMLSNDVALIGSKAPAVCITNARQLRPKFFNENGQQVAYVSAGRRLKTEPFNAGSYDAAQAHREKLSVIRFFGAADFYDALWNTVYEWYIGFMDDEQFQETIQYLIDLAVGV